MAFRLIPREERFFDDFVAMADQIRKGAGLLEEMLAPERPIWDKADEIKEVEHKCDFLTHEIIQRLNKTFVTPIDREDIHSMARALDALPGMLRLLPIAVPGDTWRPTLAVRQPAATLFYHSHVHGLTAEQVYSGLAGLLLVVRGLQCLGAHPGAPPLYSRPGPRHSRFHRR